ncbi:MAG: cobyric acid synthase [Nitrososphaeraceae archaeon]
MSKSKILMVQGTASGVGKSILVTALCRIFSNMGYKVAPFKSQNMSSKIFNLSDVEFIAKIQSIQAIASRVKPDSRINPILLIPLGNYKSKIILDGKYYKEMHAREYYEKFVLNKGFKTVLNSLQSLRKENDIIVIEGAGSPAEINLMRYDIANMLLAEKICAPVILIADIERGGCFASIVGTMTLLKQRHQKLIKGYLINKFRGDDSILYDAIKIIEKKIRKKNLGIIPIINFNLPDEDSLDNKIESNETYSTKMLNKQIDILAKHVEKNIDIDFITKNILKINL